jgi:GntR family transcriptional regulator/MocR family aminotransferase
MGYGDPAGYRPLREAISSYVGTSRGLACEPDQVVVTSERKAD